MPFTLIRGTFHVVGYSPDGDSIKFQANDRRLWKKISGRPKLNDVDRVQLRMEGIDALETHYRPSVKGAKQAHQPVQYAQAARDQLLAHLKIKNVVWGPTKTKVTSADDGVEGYILSRSVDNSQFGRPVAWVFPGKSPERDGSEIKLTPGRLRGSINYKLLNAGLVYPTYYQSLFYDLRETLTSAVRTARKMKQGLWKVDKSSGVIIGSINVIIDDHPIFPKLFRRLVEHFAQGGRPDNFRAFLADKKDAIEILPQAQRTDSMDVVVDVRGKWVGMNVQPENLVFDK